MPAPPLGSWPEKDKTTGWFALIKIASKYLKNRVLG